MNIKTGHFQYCNGGHNPGFVLDGNKEPKSLPPTGGAIGMSETMNFEEANVQLENGQTLFLYTDGVTEAVNHKMDQYTEKRLITVLRKNAALAPDEMVRFIQNEVDEYAEGLDRFDDTTCLAFRRL